MKPTFNLVILLAATLAVALLADAWRSARQDSQQLAATLATQNGVIQQASDREKQRDSQLAAALAAIQAQKRKVQTPQQAANQLPSALPPLPLPVAIHEPDLSGPLPPGETPAATLSIPQPDLVPFYNDLQNCRASSIENETLRKNLSDEKTRSEALQQERDAARAAVHGGTFFVRLQRAAKWFVIGVATGAAAVAIARR